jgi:thioredoxin 1
VQVHISKNSEWDSLVAGEQQLVAEDFWDPSCPYYGAFKPVFESVRPKGQDIEFAKANVDQMPRIASKYGIQGKHIVKFFCEGKELGEVVGYILKDNIKKDIDKRVISNPVSCLTNLSSVKLSLSNMISMLNGRESE